MSHTNNRLPKPLWCPAANCPRGPYTWRSGLRTHMVREHRELDQHEVTELLELAMRRAGAR